MVTANFVILTKFAIFVNSPNLMNFVIFLDFFIGISMIGAIHFINVQRKKNQEIQEALESGKLIKIENDQSLKIKLYNSLPLESLSKYAGVLSHKKLPEWFRPLILGLYCKLFNVNMSEALDSDLKSYQSLNEFFRRKLKPEVRPIDVQAELGIILIHFMTVLYTR